MHPHPISRLLLTAALAAVFSVCCFATDAPATDRTDSIRITDPSGGAVWMFPDQNRTTKRLFPQGGTLTITAERPISSLYLIWDAPAPTRWTLTADDRVIDRTDGFLHEWIPLDTPATHLTLTWEGRATLCDISAFDAGAPPDGVQDWRAPIGPTDLLLLPTHADDEQLYFGTIMPQYAADGRFEIQVAYMVQHNGEPYRPHELLNGLWTVGVRRYPIIPDFPDVYSDSLAHAQQIYREDEILAYQSALIRRFTPQVIIGHDLNGEYGHGAHRLNAHCLVQAVEQAADPSLPDAWNTPKVYLHLYPKNPVILDCDTPLAAFGGASAFDVAVKGFACHVSQQRSFRVERAGPYDCRKFGLLRTTVGLDQAGNDLFEHLTPYRESLPKPTETSRVPPPTAALSTVEPPPASAREKPLWTPTARNDFFFAFIGSPVAAASAVGLLLALALLFPLWKHRRKKTRR